MYEPNSQTNGIKNPSTIGLTMIWATMFLCGALVSSSYKWGFFVFALLIYYFIIWQVLGVARKYTSRVEPGVHKIFAGLAAYEIFFMYPLPPSPSPQEEATEKKS
jgi:bacteriorhodopsin